MKKSSLVIALYAVLLIIGGIMGFVKAQSVISLVISFLFAASLLGCCYFYEKGYFLGYDIAITLVLILSVFFSYRFTQNLKWMPSGMMMILSTGVFLFLRISRASFKSLKS